MKKSKAITLLSLVLFVLTVMLFVTFARFPVGIYNFNSVLGAIETNYDISGGKTYTLTLAEDNNEEVEDINSVISTLENRLNILGYSSYTVTAYKVIDEGVKDYDIRISLKGNNATDTDINTVAAFGSIRFFGDNTEDPTTEIMVDYSAVADSQYVGEQVNEDGSTSYMVSLVFTDYGYDTLKKAMNNASTEGSSNFYLKIMLGEDTIMNSQLSEASITNKTVYLTSQSVESAKQMALCLKTGGLAYKYEVENGGEITPLFGENTELKLVISFAVLYLALIIGFIVAFKGYGLIASLTLLTFMVAQLGLMIAVPGIVLSIAGVIGLLLSTILVADGLILTIKRIKEEFALGKTVKASVRVGFKRALIPNISIGVIAVVVSLALFAITGGALQNFGAIMAIGSGVAFICNVLILRMFSSLIMPIVNKKEAFLNLKREDV
ncbi:MAG: hypothetical protein IKW33_00200 [Clostridia bacterium]|nr:hypothetical protein [Clostridia bacterium]